MQLIVTVFLLMANINFAFAEVLDTNNGDNNKEQKKYDIEIIIFEDAHARYINNESWPVTEYEKSFEAEILDGHVDTNVVVLEKIEQRILEAEEKIVSETHINIPATILSAEYSRINNSSEFNVLRYVAWRQTGLSKDEAFKIELNKLDNLHTSHADNNITGSLEVVLARYLHVYCELEYKRKDETLDSAIAITTENIQKQNNYPVQCHQRMRSKELHYVDHPLIGILMQINPADITQIEKIE